MERSTHPRGGARRDITKSVSSEKYPAKKHLLAVAKHLPKPLKSDHIFLTGSKLISKGSSDEFYEFHQESNFFYCTGANSPDWYLLYSIASNKLTVFIPKPAEGKLAVYIGKSGTPEEVLRSYDVDMAHYYDHIGSILESLNGIFYTLSDSSLSSALTKARMVKDSYELRSCAKANEITRHAHQTIMKGLATKMFRTEKEIEAEFRRVCSVQGGDDQAYSPIVGAGRNASVLHYSSNKAALQGSETVLIDAATKVGGYAADVTRTYPINGKFSDRGKKLYEAVLKMSDIASTGLRPGASMSQLNDDCHDHLLHQAIKWDWIRCSFLVASKLKLGTAFFMHGLGHHIGLDVHDVTEMVPPWKCKRFDVPEAVPFVAGNIVTIEPGIYFNEEYLKTFYDNPEIGKYFNKSEIDKWMHLGGVRIEDCYLITSDGSQDLTGLEKEVSDIERLMHPESGLVIQDLHKLIELIETDTATAEPSQQAKVTMESAAPTLSRTSTFTSDESEEE